MQNYEYLNDYKQYWETEDVADKIILHVAPAVDTLNSLIQTGHENSFDFAYVDADKGNYPIYYELTYALLKQGGVMVFDNMLRDGKVIDDTDQKDDTNAIRKLNRCIHKDSRVEASLLPVGDGINIVRKIK